MMTAEELIRRLENLTANSNDVEVVLDVDEDSRRHLNISEVINGDKVIIIAADLS